MDKFRPREAMHSTAYAMPLRSVVCLSVRPSVTFMYRNE